MDEITVYAFAPVCFTHAGDLGALHASEDWARISDYLGGAFARLYERCAVRPGEFTVPQTSLHWIHDNDSTFTLTPWLHLPLPSKAEAAKHLARRLENLMDEHGVTAVTPRWFDIAWPTSDEEAFPARYRADGWKRYGK